MCDNSLKEEKVEIQNENHEHMKHRKSVRKHFMDIGFTNRLACYLIALLSVGLFMGFILAKWSVEAQYTGALMCFTVVFTPMGTALSIVLNSIVKKSQAENTWGSKGVKFATAEAAGFYADDADSDGTTVESNSTEEENTNEESVTTNPESESNEESFG